MGFSLALIHIFWNLLLLAPEFSISHPLCTDSGAPFVLNVPLGFCPYPEKSCCNSTDDSNLKKQFRAMNISDIGCASLLKSILCARCDQFSSELFRVESTLRPVPVLCNSSVASESPQYTQASNNFCSKVWDSCQNISILNSPFSPTLQSQTGVPLSSNLSKLTDFWQSKTSFCEAFGGSSVNESVCFSGEPVLLDNNTRLSNPNGLCLEKIGNGSYLSMVPHPDGSNRAFFSNQPGKIWLANIPKEGSGGTLDLEESNPFLDMTDQVYFDAAFGMMSIAFHPNFTQNGRFFASFNCDKANWPGCSGRCSCNSDVNCDPSKLPSDNGAQPCQYQTVISEFTANGTTNPPSSATSAQPQEVRRIFTMGLPFSSGHGGQILFGPKDGFLYFMMGYGGGKGDPYSFSQNKKSLLGKIMRLDVNNIPSAAEINRLDLWGNYSIPKDNPYMEDTDLQPEIWALGFRNPWRCSFDSERPSYFVCGDVGEDRYEEIDMIDKDGNYGWRLYEGPYPFNLTTLSGGNTSLTSLNLIFPVLGYDHSSVNKKEGSASITGGYFYRSNTDPCMYGRYLYADLYGAAIWAASENPQDSGNFTSNLLNFSCAHDSPIPCTYVLSMPTPTIGYIYSFGEDNNKDIFLLTSSGVYRAVRSSRCNYTCSKENVPSGRSPGSISPPFSGASRFSYGKLVLIFSLLLFMQF